MLTPRLLGHRFELGDPFFRVFLESRFAAGAADPVRLPFVADLNRSQALRDDTRAVLVFTVAESERRPFALIADGIESAEAAPLSTRQFQQVAIVLLLIHEDLPASLRIAGLGEQQLVGPLRRLLLVFTRL